jgi:hypothetical protein
LDLELSEQERFDLIKAQALLRADHGAVRVSQPVLPEVQSARVAAARPGQLESAPFGRAPKAVLLDLVVLLHCAVLSVVPVMLQTILRVMLKDKPEGVPD